MRYLILFVFFAFPATAQEIKIDKQTCKYLARHVAKPDVNYEPGKDVHGRDVAPADLNSTPQIGDTFTIPITVDLGNKYGLGKAAGTEATVGIVHVEGNKTYLNGQPLGAEDEENIAVLCLEANRKPQ
jgi:hypothetical protein